MSKECKKYCKPKVCQKKEGIERIVSISSLVIALISMLISFWSISVSNTNSKTDRRVETYTNAIVSLDTFGFYEWCLESGNEHLIDGFLNEQWMKEQVLDAVEINSKLEMFDEKASKSYWKIIEQIFGPDHIFDVNEYKKLKEYITKKI